MIVTKTDTGTASYSGTVSCRLTLAGCPISSVPPYPPPRRYPMTSSGTPDQPVPQADTAAALMEHLAEQLGSRASVSAVFGEPVTSDGITIIPVAEVGFGFAGGTRPEAGGANTGEGGGGAGARPRGYIEIKDGTATYKSLPAPWANVAIPLAALLTGTVIPLLVRHLAKRRAR